MSRKIVKAILIISFIALTVAVEWFVQVNSAPIKKEEVEEVFRTCPIPLKDEPVYLNVADYCDSPVLSKIELQTAPDGVVDFQGRKLELFKIKPLLIPAGEREKAICSAFKETAEEIRKRGGYAVAVCSCEYPVLKVGVPYGEVSSKSVTLIKLLKPAEGGER